MCRRRLSIIASPSAVLKPMVAGEIRSLRSILTTSCSTRVPDCASADQLYCPFHTANYTSPHNFACVHIEIVELSRRNASLTNTLGPFGSEHRSTLVCHKLLTQPGHPAC